MKPRLTVLIAVALLSSSTPALAQLPDWVNQILAAAQLPVVASEARRDGIANADINAVLGALLNSNVPAYEATAIIDSTRSVHRDHGPVDNFGAFVQSQLAAGKRGRELSAAIRAEHARMGKGKPGRDKSDDKSDDKSNGRGRGRGRGRSGSE